MIAKSVSFLRLNSVENMYKAISVYVVGSKP